MVYDIIDVEVTEPLPELTGSSRDGVALVLRREKRVLGFLMKSLQPADRVEPDELARWIAGEIGSRWIQESLREELGVCSALSSLPSLTVAVCSRDRPDSLERCLKSLRDLQRHVNTDKLEWETLVVDNASTDGRTEHAVAKFPGVRYVSEVRPGLNFARNRAMHEANGELLAYLDDDVVVDRCWLHGLWEAWSEQPDAAAFTGQVLPMELQTQAQVFFEKRGGFRRGFTKIRFTESKPDDDEGFLYPCRTGIFGVGCNMAFRRQILLEIGGFDEALDTGKPLPGGGDHDIFYRIIRAGFPLIYEPTYLVFHQHRRTMKQLCEQYYGWGLSVMAFASKAHHVDRPMRSCWRKLVVVWFISHLRQLIAASWSWHGLPARLMFWELAGAVVGLCGEYKRSNRRVTRIRRAAGPRPHEMLPHA